MKHLTPGQMGVTDASTRGHVTLLKYVPSWLLLWALLLLAACGPFGRSVEIDWLNFVQFHGIRYDIPTIPVGRTPTEDDLGPTFATVRFNVADNVDDPHYQLQDGDAAYLAAGTPVYSVKGYATTFRLAAQWAGQLSFYEANANPHATTGGDLLDVAGKVSSIGLKTIQAAARRSSPRSPTRRR